MNNAYAVGLQYAAKQRHQGQGRLNKFAPSKAIGIINPYPIETEKPIISITSIEYGRKDTSCDSKSMATVFPIQLVSHINLLNNQEILLKNEEDLRVQLRRITKRELLGKNISHQDMARREEIIQYLSSDETEAAYVKHRKEVEEDFDNAIKKLGELIENMVEII